RKVGLNMPVFEVFRPGNKSYDDVLKTDSLIFDMIDRKAIENLTVKPALSNSESKFLFAFLANKMFLDAFA
ncbi:MAG: asparagine synthase (glutamine-hydrolyzing), partial [Pseudomonadota bacterium]